MSQLQRPLSAVDQALVHMANRANKRKPPLDERLRLAQGNLAASQAARGATSVAEGAALANKARQEAAGGGGGLGSRTGLGAAVGAVAQGALGAGSPPPELVAENARRRRVEGHTAAVGRNRRETAATRPLQPDEPVSLGQRARNFVGGAIGPVAVTGAKVADVVKKTVQGIPAQVVAGAPKVGAFLDQAFPGNPVAVDPSVDARIINANRARGLAAAEGERDRFVERGLAASNRRFEEFKARQGGGEQDAATTRLGQLAGGGFVNPEDFQNPAINRALQSAAGRQALAAGRRARAPVQSTRENDPQLAARLAEADAALARAPKAEPRERAPVDRVAQQERREAKVAHREDVKGQLRSRSLARRARAKTLKSERLERNRQRRDTKALASRAKTLNVTPGELFVREQQERLTERGFNVQLAVASATAGGKANEAEKKLLGQIFRAVGAQGMTLEQGLAAIQAVGINLPGLQQSFEQGPPGGGPGDGTGPPDTGAAGAFLRFLFQFSPTRIGEDIGDAARIEVERERERREQRKQQRRR